MVAETTTSMNIHSQTPCLHQCLPACPPSTHVPSAPGCTVTTDDEAAQPNALAAKHYVLLASVVSITVACVRERERQRCAPAQSLHTCDDLHIDLPCLTPETPLGARLPQRLQCARPPASERERESLLGVDHSILLCPVLPRSLWLTGRRRRRVTSPANTSLPFL